ncbi:MAG: hypothetical protein M3419_11745 [Actinomycetota bacterium]|nr:hypothetical protein [Actinomycetota bacterium]
MRPAIGHRVFLHIGLHKSGTTFLQNVCRANRDGLAAQGIHFPGGKGRPNHTFAVYDLFGRRPRGSEDDRISGQWDAITHDILESSSPTSLISEEALSLASPAQARKAVRSFADAEVHVVVTARDLGRVALSAWQEDIKTDQTWIWRAYADALADHGARGQSPARGFWLRQDLPAVLAIWAGVVPSERVHVVTVPPPGADAAILLQRMGEVVGFDGSSLGEPGRWDNTSMGVAGTEVLRRMNVHLHRRLNQRQYHDVVETVLAPILARDPAAIRLSVPESDRHWIDREAASIIVSVREAGYHVVGDLEDLRPVYVEGGRAPDAVDTGELLDAAVLALAGLTERFALAKWSRRKDSARITDAPTAARAGSAVRATWFKGKRAAVNLADRNQVAAGGLGAFLRARNSLARRRAER